MLSLTENVLGARDSSDLISMVSFTFTIRRHLIWLASAPFTSSRLAKFGCVPFAVCNAWQRSRTQNYYGAWMKTPVLFSPVCGPKFTKFAGDVGDPSYFPTPLPDCLKIFAIKSQNRLKKEQSKSFLAHNFCEGRPRL